jgi:uncharacterized protein (TIGR02246 family)
MKTIILSITLLWAVLPAIVQSQTISTADSLEITQKIYDWNRAWGEKDHELAAKWYVDHAEWTNAFGHNHVGSTEIGNFLKEVFQLPFVMAGQSRTTSQHLIAVSDDVILVITTVERTGQTTPDGTELGVRKSTHHRVFKKDPEWLIVGHLISDARDTELARH